MQQDPAEEQRTTEEKTCPGCDRRLPLKSFHKDNRCTGQRAKTCRECNEAEPLDHEAQVLVATAIDPDSDPVAAIQAARKLLKTTFPKPIHSDRWKANSGVFSTTLADRLRQEQELAKRVQPAIPVNMENVKARWLMASLVLAAHECAAEGDVKCTRIRHHLGNTSAECLLDDASEYALSFEDGFGVSLDGLVLKADGDARNELEANVDLLDDEREEQVEEAGDANLHGLGAFDSGFIEEEASTPVRGPRRIKPKKRTKKIERLIEKLGKEAGVAESRIVLLMEYTSAEDKAAFAEERGQPLRQIQNAINYTRNKVRTFVTRDRFDALAVLVGEDEEEAIQQPIDLNCWRELREQEKGRRSVA